MGYIHGGRDRDRKRKEDREPVREGAREVERGIDIRGSPILGLVEVKAAALESISREQAVLLHLQGSCVSML